MKALTCKAAGRRLHAFCDGELPLQDQIAVSAHLDWCTECSHAVEELRLLRASLRSLPARPVLSGDDELGFRAEVVWRAKGDRDTTVSKRLSVMFDDMHLVYAGAAAAAAALVCVFVAVATFGSTMSSMPGSDLNPVPIDASVLMPRPLERMVPVTLPDDAVFSLAAVVTRDGRVANLELLQSKEELPKGQAVDQAIAQVMGAMSQARYEPARVDGQAVAVSMVWFVERTTVRGDVPRDDPPVKKQIGVAGPYRRLGSTSLVATLFIESAARRLTPLGPMGPARLNS